MMIDVSAHPVCVRDVCIRARGDQQSLGLEAIVRELFVGMVPVKRESALQPAAKVQQMLQPPPVRRELVAVGQAVSLRDSLERKVRQRRRGFSDRKARVRGSLDEYDVPAELREDAGEQRAREAAADDGD